MDIKNAIEVLLISQEFKEKAKEKNNEGGKLRMFVTRYQRKEISTAAAVAMLEKFGYEVKVFPSKKSDKAR